MKLQTSLLAVAIGTCLSLGTASATEASSSSHRYIVDLKPGADAAHVSAVLTQHGVQVKRVLTTPEGVSIAVDVDFAHLPDLAQLRTALPEVAGYEFDVKRFPAVYTGQSTDPAASAATPLYSDVVTASGETLPWGIQAVQAQQVNFGSKRKVCIIDGGYALGHEDLQTASVTGQDRGAGPWHGDPTVSGYALADHGTHVAGTIAGLGGNGKGVVGVVANGELDLHIVRSFDAGGAWTYASDLAGAMQDCADAGANVVSMSLGGPYSSRLEERMVNKLNRQGVLLVAAAGNGGSYGMAFPKNDFATFAYPAGYDAVMTVAAVDSNLKRASFSQYTADSEISGPGTWTFSTISGDRKYAMMNGTSMATPHVSGVAALVWSNYPQCTNHQIRNALKQSARDLNTPGYDYHTGYGLVQAKAAVDYLATHACTGTGSGLGNSN